MKKTLIAGAASVALAALPMAGVFATDPATVNHGGTLTDTFNVTIARQCIMTRKTSSQHTNGNNGTVDKTWSTSGNTDTLEMGALTTGASYSLGSSTFNVVCNGTDGYQVRAAIVNFTNGTDPINASSSAIVDADLTGNNPSSSWTIQYSADDDTSAYLATDGVFRTVNNPTLNAGDDFTMTYRLGLADGQASGTYSASVAYTLYDMTATDPVAQ